MSSRIRKVASLEDENDERKPPAKRQRLKDEDTTNTSTHCLLSLNNDCLLNVLSRLHFNDLNNIAMCNKQLNQLRAHESLNQTRTATLICRRGTTSRSFVSTIDENDWNSELVGNWTHLRIEHLERLSDTCIGYYEARQRPMVQRGALTNIRSLDCSLPQRIGGEIPYNVFRIIPHLLPNLREVDLTHIRTPAGSIGVFCRNLFKITWNHSSASLYFDGFVLHRAPKLVELYIDDCHFIQSFDITADAGEATLPEDRRLLWRCDSLERVSMKNSSFSVSQGETTVNPVTQDMLVAFVRNKPALRWFRSDLTAENVAMLRGERPEVTFVSD